MPLEVSARESGYSPPGSSAYHSALPSRVHSSCIFRCDYLVIRAIGITWLAPQHATACRMKGYSAFGTALIPEACFIHCSYVQHFWLTCSPVIARLSRPCV